MDVYEAVIKRRSIRRFKDITVPYSILEKCVDAARLAPVGRNRQLCEYIIVDDEGLLPRVFDNVGTWAGKPAAEGGAPPGHRPKAYIITMINKTLETELGGSSRSANYNAGLAVENMILVAQEQGIGTCAILSFGEIELKKILNIPYNYEIALLLALGYPDERPVTEVSTGSIQYWIDNQGIRHVPKRKLEDILHRNKFPQ